MAYAWGTPALGRTVVWDVGPAVPRPRRSPFADAGRGLVALARTVKEAFRGRPTGGLLPEPTGR